MIITLNLTSLFVIIVIVIVVANSVEYHDEYDDEYETNVEPLERNQSIDIYQEMLKIVEKNNLKYNKIIQNQCNFFTKENKKDFELKYESSKPIPIPYKINQKVN
jgi:hypothetical protein